MTAAGIASRPRGILKKSWCGAAKSGGERKRADDSDSDDILEAYNRLDRGEDLHKPQANASSSTGRTKGKAEKKEGLQQVRSSSSKKSKSRSGKKSCSSIDSNGRTKGRGLKAVGFMKGTKFNLKAVGKKKKGKESGANEAARNEAQTEAVKPAESSPQPSSAAAQPVSQPKRKGGGGVEVTFGEDKVEINMHQRNTSSGKDGEVVANKSTSSDTVNKMLERLTRSGRPDLRVAQPSHPPAPSASDEDVLAASPEARAYAHTDVRNATPKSEGSTVVSRSKNLEQLLADARREAGAISQTQEVVIDSSGIGPDKEVPTFLQFIADKAKRKSADEKQKEEAIIDKKIDSLFESLSPSAADDFAADEELSIATEIGQEEGDGNKISKHISWNQNNSSDDDAPTDEDSELSIATEVIQKGTKKKSSSSSDDPATDKKEPGKEKELAIVRVIQKGNKKKKKSNDEPAADKEPPKEKVLSVVVINKPTMEDTAKEIAVKKKSIEKKPNHSKDGGDANEHARNGAMDSINEKIQNSRQLHDAMVAEVLEHILEEIKPSKSGGGSVGGCESPPPLQEISLEDDDGALSTCALSTAEEESLMTKTTANDSDISSQSHDEGAMFSGNLSNWDGSHASVNDIALDKGEKGRRRMVAATEACVELCEDVAYGALELSNDMLTDLKEAINMLFDAGATAEAPSIICFERSLKRTPSDISSDLSDEFNLNRQLEETMAKFYRKYGIPP